MNCPKCGDMMSVKKSDESFGDGKTYDRVQYICSGDDIWVTVETPQIEEVEEDEK